MDTTIDYWFTIEPYVFISYTAKSILLYNTLDGTTIESENEEVIELLKEIIQEKNCGVVLLTHKRYKRKYINLFITELREKYMGDVIDVTLSKGKPVQLLPFFNFPGKYKIYKRHNFSLLKNVLEHLLEISIHVNTTTDVEILISFIQSIPGSPTLNIIGNIEEVTQYTKLLSYLNQLSSPKNILCCYRNVIALQPLFDNNFSYRISVDFPIDMQQWEISRQILLNQTLTAEYIFDISSDEEFWNAERIIDEFQIEKYCLNPVYIGSNILFFKKNVFLTKEDILSTHMTIKDFFSRQAMNIYDYGKINIMPNGDTYANLNYPMLGNIYTDSIYEIVQKEVDEGQSWFRVRNHTPCSNCVYQWLCPSPSSYEILIGRPNLCHVNNEIINN